VLRARCSGWFLLAPVVLIWLAVVARGWGLAAGVLLVLATPLIAAFSYAVGSYDARLWWEAYSGLLTAAAGLCPLVDAAVHQRFGTHGIAVVVTDRTA
jgi:hypothetical protein